MNAKAKYRELCRTNADIPLSSQDWWLDWSAGEENWDVVVAERDGRIEAALPYVVEKRAGMRRLGMPPQGSLTLGAWVRARETSGVAEKLDREKELVAELIRKLPPFDLFSAWMHWKHSYVAPFCRQGFRADVFYTHVLPLSPDFRTVESGFRESVVRDAGRAEAALRVSDAPDMERLYSLAAQRIGANEAAPSTLAQALALDEICERRGCRRMWFAEDARGRVHAVLYIVWDCDTAYLLMSGEAPLLRTSGAKALLLREAIRFACRNVRYFDFRTKTPDPEDRHCQSFGARPAPNIRITKYGGGRLATLASRIKRSIAGSSRV